MARFRGSSGNDSSYLQPDGLWRNTGTAEDDQFLTGTGNDYVAASGGSDSYLLGYTSSASYWRFGFVDSDHLDYRGLWNALGLATDKDLRLIVSLEQGTIQKRGVGGTLLGTDTVSGLDTLTMTGGNDSVSGRDYWDYEEFRGAGGSDTIDGRGNEDAVSYSDNDNCVVRSDLEITKDNAADLAGKKVAVPLGTAAHYGVLKQMAHFGVDVASLEVVDMAPPDGAAAIAQGAVDMACGYGGGLNRMKEHGNVLLTVAEKEAMGILVFDVTSSPAPFVAENPDVVAKFLKVVADSNAMWNEGSKKAEMLPVIAKDAGMDEATAEKDMSTFVFPSVDDQLSAKWLGGGAQDFMLGVAGVFVQAGSIPAALDNYAAQVNVGPLTAAKGM